MASGLLDMIDLIFSHIKKYLIDSAWFIKWLSSKPTGQFVIQVNLNQGGVIGKPKIIITDNAT